MRGLKELMALSCWGVEEQIEMEEMEGKVLATSVLVEVGKWGKALLGHWLQEEEEKKVKQLEGEVGMMLEEANL